MILSVKEMALLFECSEKTARAYFKEIRKIYHIKHVTKFHIAEWLNIDAMAVEISYCYRVRKNIELAEVMIQIREKLISNGALSVKSGKYRYISDNMDSAQAGM